jgi:hypothetical protein
LVTKNIGRLEILMQDLDRNHAAQSGFAHTARSDGYKDLIGSQTRAA